MNWKKIVSIVFMAAIAVMMVVISIWSFDYNAYCAIPLSPDIEGTEMLYKSQATFSEGDLARAVICHDDLENKYQLSGNVVMFFSDGTFEGRILGPEYANRPTFELTPSVSRFLLINQFARIVQVIALCILAYGFYNLLFVHFLDQNGGVEKYLLDFFSTLALFMPFSFILLLVLSLMGWI